MDHSQPDSSRLEALNILTWEGYLFTDPDSAFLYAQQQIDFAEPKGLFRFVAKALNTQGAAYSIRNQNDKAIPFYEKSIRYHQKAGYKKGVASVLNNLGNIYYDAGEYVKAQENYRKSLELLIALGDKKSAAMAQSNIGNVYTDQGDYANAIDFFNTALHTSESLEDTNGIANAFNNIGIVYNHLNEHEQAILLFKKSLALYEKNEFKYQLAIAHNLNNIGNTYSYLFDDEQALKFYDKALVMYEKSGNTYHQANTLNNIGTIHFEQQAYQKANAYFNRCLTLFEAYGDPAGSITPLNNIGRIHFAQGNHKKALEYSKKSLTIAKEIGNGIGIQNAAEFLYEVYKANNNFPMALKMHELYRTMRDSLQSEENQSRVLRQEYQHRYEKKAATDSLKAIEKQIISQARITTQQAQLEKEKTLRYALYSGVALLLLFGAIMYQRFRLIRQQKNVIELQKKEVEQQKGLLEVKNKEILDSINYAQRIQRAILPPDSHIKAQLNASFVLYLPKDVVAGDFYWMEKHPKGVLFAAADCTGHGVPGAMVSVVCHNSLNRAVREFGLHDPGAILDKTRELLIQEFEKSDEEVRDGMDIALCALNGKRLLYSGANNPLWIVREEKLIEIKANKQPIGKFEISQPYTTHTVDLQTGDTIYLFSDGFVDQFGGKQSKKFMSKAFKKLLISIQHVGMQEQHQALLNAFTDWKEKEEQVDDVCVIGVHIEA